jgi:hypothetical protein
MNKMKEGKINKSGIKRQMKGAWNETISLREIKVIQPFRGLLNPSQVLYTRFLLQTKVLRIAVLKPRSLL